MGTGILGTGSAVRTRFTAGCSALGTGSTADCSAWITGNREAALLWARVSCEAAMSQVLALLVAHCRGQKVQFRVQLRQALTSIETAEQQELGS